MYPFHTVRELSAVCVVILTYSYKKYISYLVYASDEHSGDTHLGIPS